MKVTETKEIEYSHASLDLHIDMKNGQHSISLKYDCPSCGGYGCGGRNGNCYDGRLAKKIELKDFFKTLDTKHKELLSTIFTDTLNSIKE